MFGPDVELIFLGELLVLGHQAAAVGDPQPAPTPGHLHGLADEREGHRVAIGLEADEVVRRHAARLAGLEPERGLAGRHDQVNRTRFVWTPRVSKS